MRIIRNKRRKSTPLSLVCIFGTMVLGLLAGRIFFGKMLIGGGLLLFFLCCAVTLYCRLSLQEPEDDTAEGAFEDHTSTDGEEDVDEPSAKEVPNVPLSTREKVARCFGEVALVLVMLLLFWSEDYSYANGSCLTAFWPIALGIAAVAGVAVVKKFFWKSSRAGRAFSILFCGLLIYVAVSVCAAHLNYLLDLEEPTDCVAVIEEKDRVKSSKRGDSYQFQVTVDGKTFDIEVSANTYHSYAVGDGYRFHRYKGAFGVPFYMPLY